VSEINYMYHVCMYVCMHACTRPNTVGLQLKPMCIRRTTKTESHLIQQDTVITAKINGISYLVNMALSILADCDKKLQFSILF